MSREYVVYIALLALSLVAAYLSSLADKTVGEQAKITVFSVPMSDLESGHYYSEEQDFSLIRAADGHRLLVRQVQRDKPDPTDRATPPQQETKTIFLANEDFASVFASFTPLLAKRVLGQASAIDLALFGLQVGQARLVLQTKDKTRGRIELSIGKKSYGSAEFYVQYDGTVYLVTGRSIDKIARARALLFEEQLLAVAFTDGVQAELQADGNSMTAVLQGTLAELRHGRERHKSDGKWLVDGKEQKQFGNWLRRLRTLEVMAYREQLPAAAQEVMTLVLRQDADELERLRFWHWQTATQTDVFFGQSKFSGELYTELPAGRMLQLTHDLRKGGFLPTLK